MNQNQEEAKEWLKFLCEHTDKEELKTLEDEIGNRFVLNLMLRLILENWMVEEFL